MLARVNRLFLPWECERYPVVRVGVHLDGHPGASPPASLYSQQVFSANSVPQYLKRVHTVIDVALNRDSILT